MPLFAIIFLTGAVLLCISLSVCVIRLGEKPVKTSLIFVLVSIILVLVGIGLGHAKIFRADSAAVSQKAALSDDEIKKIITSGESIVLNICNLGFRAQVDGQPKVSFTSLRPILEGYYTRAFIDKQYKDFYEFNLSSSGYGMMEVFSLADEFQAEESFIEARQIDADNIQARFLMPAVTGPSQSPASIDTYTLTESKGKWVISAMQSTVVSTQPVNAQEPAVSGSNLQKAEQYDELGKEHMDKGYFDQALACVNKAIGLNPKNEEYYHNAARMLSLAGNPSGSNTYCDKALQINPRCSQCYLRKANNFEEVQAYDEAINSANRVFQNAGSSEDQVMATALIARCYNQKEQYYDSINFCNEKLESLKPTASASGLVMVYSSLIMAYDAVGNYYQALEEARNIDNMAGSGIFYEGFRTLYKAKGIIP